MQPNYYQENYQVVNYRINLLHATVQNDFHYRLLYSSISRIDISSILYSFFVTLYLVVKGNPKDLSKASIKAFLIFYQ